MERKLRRGKKITRKHATLKPEDYSDPEEDMARQRSEVVSSAREQAKDQKRKKPTRERWLLTRKTWRYMADAGRRLIPEGSQNRVEDIPKLEAYFQEVCQKEKRFLLWRKSSYPGALNFRVYRKKQRDRKKWGSCRENASSADEAEQQKRLFEVETISGGRFDIQKLRQQFLDSGPPAGQTGDEFAMRHKALKPIPDQTRYLPDVPECSATQQEDVSPEDDERELMDTLLYLLSREQYGDPDEKNEEEEQKAVDYTKLLCQLKKYLSQSNSGDAQIATDSDQDMYKTTTTDFEKKSPGANSRNREYPVSEVSTKSEVSLKNRKGLLTDEYEDNREAVTLRSTPQSTRDDDYKYGYERVNLRRNANSVSSSTEDTKADKNLKSRDEFQSGSQPRSGFVYQLGKTNSDVHPRTAPSHYSVSGQQNIPGPSYRRIPRTGSGNVYFEGDHLQKLLIETLRRYYNKSNSRDKVITDILTDRKVLDKLYFDLRKARNFKGRSGQTDAQDKDRHNWKTSTEKMYDVRNEGGRYDHNDSLSRGWKGSEKTLAKRPCDLPLYTKPPTIAVEQEAEPRWASKMVQTLPVPEEVMTAIEEFSKREKEKPPEQKEEKEENELKPPPVVTRRRSSVDHDDVSPSVSDTIKRYLKMARKKSVDADKVDRFKRVNYDRNLRNIKPKGEISRPGDDDGLNKGCQTEETWVAALKELKQDDIGVLSEEDDYQRSRVTSCRSSFDSTTYDEALLSPPSPVHGKPHSPGILSSGQSFLSNLLHGRHHHDVSQPGSPVAAGAAMQKSKSSSSVVHQGSRIVARKIWRTRSKSQSRAVPSVTSTWTPQGRCTWSSVTGAQVTLADTSLVQLTDLERRVLQKVALAKLQALNLGVAVRVPSETLAADTPHKPKRRPHLLKRKALTTSFFDTVAGKSADKDKDGGGGGVGLVFGIPISQCLENDRLARGAQGSDSDQSRLRRKSHHGSRSSCTSLTDNARPEQAGSCDSLDLVASSVPGLLNTLSSELEGLERREPGVPSLVASCCQHLEVHGLNTLGIFRVSSSKKRVRQLREVFDSGKETQLDDDVCPHDVATLLKEFFRDLPEPLLCRDLYLAFLQTQRIRNRRLQFEALQHLVQQLPVPNRDTLWALLAFLSKVARHAPDYTDEKGESVAGNKMDSGNLATLFAPNILHGIRPGSAKDVSTETTEERVDAISVVRAMIDHHDQLFTVSAELLDEVYLHMMDSHPEALDYLLRRQGLLADKSTDDLEAGAPDEAPLLEDEGEEQERGVVRRVWSREEFLHESAGTGGPHVSMRPRHKERQHSRVRHSKKHWWEDAARAGGSDAEGASSDTGSSFGSSHLAKDLFSSASRLDEDSRRKSTPVLLDGGGSVITASLKIPAPFSRDDADIAFVEDAAAAAAAHRQVTVGVVRSTTRHRHVSTSGSDSSSAVASPGLQETRTVSPPSSISPPPSWASSPPNSPDGTVTSVDYLPEPRQQRPVAITAKEITPVILHKVTFASSAGGEQRMQLLSQPGDLPKSASTSAISAPQREQPAPASISSIGGAVMRSKTADIERILRIHKPAEGGQGPAAVVAERDADANKYSKRRYTDSRHQTRYIPDCEALEAGGASAVASSQPHVPVYKRRELIASDPKDHETFL